MAEVAIMPRAPRFWGPRGYSIRIKWTMVMIDLNHGYVINFWIRLNGYAHDIH
jgi:hypothetical protein